MRTIYSLLAVHALAAGCSMDEVGTPDFDIGTEQQAVIAYASTQVLTTTTTETRYTPATVAFTATAGTKYRLRSKIQLSSNTQKAYVQAVVYCKNSSNQTLESITHQQNILTPNGSLTLYPRLVWQATSNGGHTCHAAFDIRTFQGSGSVTITNQSYVENVPVHPSAQDTVEPANSRLAVGQALDVAVDDDFTIPDLTEQIAASGDVLWTLCVGSVDRPELPCEVNDNTQLATLQVQVSIFQRGPAGEEWCHQWGAYSPPASSTVGIQTHHATFYGGGTFVPDPDCGTSARLKIWVKNAAGGPIAIHKNGTVMAVMPDASPE